MFQSEVPDCFLETKQGVHHTAVSCFRGALPLINMAPDRGVLVWTIFFLKGPGPANVRFHVHWWVPWLSQHVFPQQLLQLRGRLCPEIGSSGVVWGSFHGGSG